MRSFFLSLSLFEHHHLHVAQSVICFCAAAKSLMNKHAIDADVTRGREGKEWTGIWSVVYLTRAQIHREAAA